MEGFGGAGGLGWGESGRLGYGFVKGDGREESVVLVMGMEIGDGGSGGWCWEVWSWEGNAVMRRVHEDRWVRYWIVASVMSDISRGVGA